MKEERKPDYPEKTPDAELQKMPHTKARKFKPQPRLELSLSHSWQARKADVLTITPPVTPSNSKDSPALPSVSLTVTLFSTCKKS